MAEEKELPQESLTINIEPFDASFQGFTLKSDNEEVLKLVDQGEGYANFQAAGEGEANVIITTDEGGFTATCKVTVEKYVPVTGVSFDQDEIRMYVGQQLSVGRPS